MIWGLLKVGTLETATTPFHLLVLYRWMKSYDTELGLKIDFKGKICDKTIRKWIKYLLPKVAELRKVKIDPNWFNHNGILLGRTVDGIHYAIDEPRPFNTIYSSHKLGGKAGLMYEYVLATDRNTILWLNGPFPAGLPDIKVCEEKGLTAAIRALQAELPGARVIADDGYFKNKLVDVLLYRNELDPREINWFKDRALSRHESFNKLTRNYNCLGKTPFLHDHSSGNEDASFPMHKACVEAVCVTIQIEFDLGEKALLDPYPS